MDDEAPKNGLPKLSKALGVREAELREVFKEVQQNHALLRACTRHQFPKAQAPILGQRHYCLNCGGWMAGDRVITYEEGVRHAGQPFEVWVDTDKTQA